MHSAGIQLKQYTILRGSLLRLNIRSIFDRGIVIYGVSAANYTCGGDVQRPIARGVQSPKKIRLTSFPLELTRT